MKSTTPQLQAGWVAVRDGILDHHHKFTWPQGLVFHRLLNLAVRTDKLAAKLGVEIGTCPGVGIRTLASGMKKDRKVIRRAVQGLIKNDYIESRPEGLHVLKFRKLVDQDGDDDSKGGHIAPGGGEHPGAESLAGKAETGAESLAGKAESYRLNMLRRETGDEKEETMIEDPEDPDQEAKAIWTTVLKVLEKRTNSHVYKTWFTPTRAVGCRQNVLLVQAPNDHFCGWLRKQHASEIAEVLEELGHGQLKVEFEAADTGTATRSA